MILYGIVRHPELLQPELVYEIASGGGKPGFLDAFKAILDYDFRDRLPEIERPTLIVWGRNDRIVPVGGAYRYEQLIPNSRRVIFEDTGHVPMIERPGAVQPGARGLPRRVAGAREARQPGTRSRTASWRTSGAPLTACSTSSSPRASSSRM